MQHQREPVQRETATGNAAPAGRLYEISGRRLWLHRSGSGGPAVVFLPGPAALVSTT